MNKQQEYFEKSVVPYRQRIRELDVENDQLFREKAILRTEVEGLECENERLQKEIESLMKFANLQPEDRKKILERSGMITGFNQLFSSVSRYF